MNANKQLTNYLPVHNTLTILTDFDILRSDYCIDRLSDIESIIPAIYALKYMTIYLNQLIIYHLGIDDVAISDEVGNKGILRLIIYLFRCSHLLNVSIVHNDDSIRHR